jgi:MYXO-CTERM domain-containing protein
VRPGPEALEDVDGGCACRTGAPARGSSGALAWFALAWLVAWRRRAWLAALPALLGCASPLPEHGAEERCEPPVATTAEALSSIDCNEGTDTGYSSGNPFPINVVTVDGKKVEVATANAYYVMAQAAAAAGVNLKVVSGFRTMAEQQYLYGCYVNCNCNNCNLAAKPGYSNHQSGHALDLNTSSGGVYAWLEAHAGGFGFQRTVPSEPWHWEWWGGGPGGGPCGGTAQNCSSGQASACGNYGCWCVNGECNGGFCPGNGCTAQDVTNCAAFGCQCVDGQCNGGFCPGQGCTAKEVTDCAAFGCQCVDHQCNGGFCPGQGCTAKEITDCGNYGCNCVDHQCSGGFCPGQGCTAKETLDCEAKGCGCVDHVCSGGACEGTGCTAKQTIDCEAEGKVCKDTKCVAAPSPGEGGSGGGSGTAGAGGDGAATASGGAGGGSGTGWGSPGGGGAGGNGSAESPLPADHVETEDVEGSCACRQAGGVGGAPLLASLLGALLVVGRIRRRHPH